MEEDHWYESWAHLRPFLDKQPRNDAVTSICPSTSSNCKAGSTSTDRKLKNSELPPCQNCKDEEEDEKQIQISNRRSGIFDSGLNFLQEGLTSVKKKLLSRSRNNEPKLKVFSILKPKKPKPRPTRPRPINLSLVAKPVMIPNSRLKTVSRPKQRPKAWPRTKVYEKLCS